MGFGHTTSTWHSRARGRAIKAMVVLAALVGLGLAFQTAPVPRAAASRACSLPRRTALPRLLVPDENILSETIDRALAYETDEVIIPQFRRKGAWLWRQWRGTVLEFTWVPASLNMLVGLTLTFFIRRVGTLQGHIWPLGAVPSDKVPIVARLMSVHVMWSYQLTLTTFILTFFISQAYAFWREQFSLARRVQGRLLQFSLLLSAHASRLPTGECTPKAKELLTATARNVRLCHITFWAGQCQTFKALLQPSALSALQARGALTESEADALERVPPKARHDVVIQWMLIRALAGLKSGALQGNPPLEAKLMDQVNGLHGACGGIMDNKEDRMPVAYVHIVQVLVDSLVLLIPAALYPKVGIVSVPLAGLLTVFYRGLLEIGKEFLDPFNGDDETDINVDVLLAEVNAGSDRLPEAIATIPDTIPIQ